MKILPYDIFRLHVWWNKGFRDALKLHNKIPFDIIHAHDLDTLPIGVKLKIKLDIPLIYDAHEIWGYLISNYLPKPWANYYLKKERNLLKNVDQIITVNKPLKDYFQRISNKPVSIIMNCKPLNEVRYKPPKNDKFTLLYLGSLGPSRFLLELAEKVEELSDVQCIIAGRGKKEFVSRLQDKCSTIENVDFIGLITMDEVISKTKNADAVVCMTNPGDPNNSIATANKQFEAMVCGRPVICTNGTYPGVFTEENKCGLVSKYTKEDLKNTILKLKDNPELCEELGKNALKAAINQYNWGKQEVKLNEIYKKFNTFSSKDQ